MINHSEISIHLNDQKSWTFYRARRYYSIAFTNVHNKHPEFVWGNHICPLM